MLEQLRRRFKHQNKNSKMKLYRIYFKCYLGSTEKAPSHICWQVVEAYDREHAKTKFDKWEKLITKIELIK